MVYSDALIHLLFFTHLVIACLLAGWYAYHRLTVHERGTGHFLPAQRAAHHYHLALICDYATPAIARLKKSMLTQLNCNDDHYYEIDILEGYNRNSLTRHHLRTALRSDYDCLISASIFTTQLAQEVLTASKDPLPLVFGNIAHAGNHIVQHPTAHQWTTGVLHERDIAVELEQLMLIINPVRKALIIEPQHTVAWTESDTHQLKEFFTDNQLTFTTYRACNRDSQQIVRHLIGCNLLIVMQGALPAEQFKQVANYCSRIGITMYTTDIDAVEYGAALGSGGGEKAIGTMMAQKIADIVQRGVPAHHIPITTITPSPTVRFNKAVLTDQSLTVSPQNLFVIGRGQTHSTTQE